MLSHKCTSMVGAARSAAAFVRVRSSGKGAQAFEFALCFFQRLLTTRSRAQVDLVTRHKRDRETRASVRAFNRTPHASPCRDTYLPSVCLAACAHATMERVDHDPLQFGGGGAGGGAEAAEHSDGDDDAVQEVLGVGFGGGDDEHAAAAAAVPSAPPLPRLARPGRQER